MMLYASSHVISYFILFFFFIFFFIEHLAPTVHEGVQIEKTEMQAPQEIVSPNFSKVRSDHRL